jgi:hypothetical protein
MFKVKESFLNNTAYCAKFKVVLKDATQDQLEHLYHLGVDYITTTKKVKNKQHDNAKTTEESQETNTGYTDFTEVGPEC